MDRENRMERISQESDDREESVPDKCTKVIARVKERTSQIQIRHCNVSY